MDLMMAGFVLAIVWVLSMLLVYFGVYMASRVVWGDPYRDSPHHHFLALVATLIWCAVTANLQVPMP